MIFKEAISPVGLNFCCLPCSLQVNWELVVDKAALTVTNCLFVFINLKVTHVRSLQKASKNRVLTVLPATTEHTKAGCMICDFSATGLLLRADGVAFLGTRIKEDVFHTSSILNLLVIVWYSIILISVEVGVKGL